MCLLRLFCHISLQFFFLSFSVFFLCFFCLFVCWFFFSFFVTLSVLLACLLIFPISILPVYRFPCCFHMNVSVKCVVRFRNKHLSILFSCRSMSTFVIFLYFFFYSSVFLFFSFGFVTKPMTMKNDSRKKVKENIDCTDFLAPPAFLQGITDHFNRID